MYAFCHLVIFFDLLYKFNNLSGKNINMFGPDQAGRFVRPDLGENCLQRLSVFNKKRVHFSPFLFHFTFISEKVQ